MSKRNNTSTSSKNHPNIGRGGVGCPCGLCNPIRGRKAKKRSRKLANRWGRRNTKTNLASRRYEAF